jgi:hypothetical protein
MEVSGEFNNNHEVHNSGILAIYRHMQSTFSDSYRITAVNNSGEIVNSVGEIHNEGTINNYGTISNQLGEIYNRWDGAHAVINNAGTISNISGKISNEGIIRNDCSGIVEGELEGNVPSDSCHY